MATLRRKPHIIILEDEEEKKKEKDDEEGEEEDTDYYTLNPVEAKLTRISLHLNTLDLSNDKKTELDEAIGLLRSNPKQFLETFNKSQETEQKNCSPNIDNKESLIEDLDFPNIEQELLNIANSIKEMTLSIPNIPKIPPCHSLKDNDLYTVKEEFDQSHLPQPDFQICDEPKKFPLEYQKKRKPSAPKIAPPKIIPPPFLTKVCSKNDEEDEEIDLSDYYEKPCAEKFSNKPPKIPPPSPTLPKRSLELTSLKEDPSNSTEYYEKPGTHSFSVPPPYTEQYIQFSGSVPRPNQHKEESIVNIPKRVEEQPRRVKKSSYYFCCSSCFSYLVLFVGILNVLLYLYIVLLSQKNISVTTIPNWLSKNRN